ncbi:hypothetical protein DSECCO2_641300 [anaerobic digester metagenome]
MRLEMDVPAREICCRDGIRGHADGPVVGGHRGSVGAFEPAQEPQHGVGRQGQRKTHADHREHVRQNGRQTLPGKLDPALEPDGQQKQNGHEFVYRARQAQLRPERAGHDPQQEKKHNGFDQSTHPFA